MDAYYGVDSSELQSLLTSEQVLIENEINNFKKRIKMDGHYVSNGKIEEIIREAEILGKVFYREKTLEEIKPEFDKLLSSLYGIRHDSSNFRNKYDSY